MNKSILEKSKTNKIVRITSTIKSIEMKILLKGILYLCTVIFIELKTAKPQHKQLII